ncbi:hypothetical protein [Actinoallomurus sp. NPDC050550]|uniref:hypothetical protein n=1 Tax=Actinoallomurus sp. NPDC050550 TaxID=3154937 RepID=UPI0033CF1142
MRLTLTKFTMLSTSAVTFFAGRPYGWVKGSLATPGTLAAKNRIACWTPPESNCSDMIGR